MSRLLKRFPAFAGMVRRWGGLILHEPEIDLPFETVGSTYGAHTIPRGGVDADSVVYSFGIGTDVSFDLGLIERYQCAVHGFDPTPRSMAWVAAEVREPRFVFHNFGIGEEDADVPFNRPAEAAHVSYSRPAGDTGSDLFAVRRLATIMATLGHRRIDVLKLDIEGFEYAVLKDVLASGIHPHVIAVEYHHRMYGIANDATNASVAALRQAGYRLFFVSETGREYSFLRDHDGSPAAPKTPRLNGGVALTAEKMIG